MKFLKQITTLFIVVFTTSFLTFNSCKKDPCSGISCGNGVCFNGSCNCNAGYEGAACQTLSTDKFCGNYSGASTPDNSGQGNDVSISDLYSSSTVNQIRITGIGYTQWSNVFTKLYDFQSYVTATIGLQNGAISIVNQTISSGVENYTINGTGSINLNTQTLQLNYTSKCNADTTLNTSFSYTGIK